MWCGKSVASYAPSSLFRLTTHAPVQVLVRYRRQSLGYPQDDTNYRQRRGQDKAEQILDQLANELKISTEEAADIVDKSLGTFDDVKGMMAHEKEKVDEHLRKKRYAMTMKKVAPRPVVENLLTWSAKQQVRILHREDPHKWSVEALARSFPCTENYVKILLKDRKIMYSQEHVDRHDAVVKQRWAWIASGEYEDKLAKGTVDLLREKGNLVKNAAGIKSLAIPEPPDEFVDYKGKPGMFSSILRDYKTYVTKEAGEFMKKERETLKPDKSVSYNIGYLNPPPQDPASQSNPIYRKKITFDELKRQHPGIASGVPPSAYDHTHGMQETQDTSERDYMEWKKSKEQGVFSDHGGAHSETDNTSYFNAVQSEARRILANEKRRKSTTHTERQKKKSIFAVPSFIYSVNSGKI